MITSKQAFQKPPVPFGNYKINQPLITMPTTPWTFFVSLASPPCMPLPSQVDPYSHVTALRMLPHSSFHLFIVALSGRQARVSIFTLTGFFRDFMTCRMSQYKQWKRSRKWSLPIPCGVCTGFCQLGRRAPLTLFFFVIYLCPFSQNLGQDKYKVYGMVASMREKRKQKGRAWTVEIQDSQTTHPFAYLLTRACQLGGVDKTGGKACKWSQGTDTFWFAQPRGHA